MLNAVANFLFGSEPTRPAAPPQEVLDYEVREADDWLLVDVSDQEDNFDAVDCEDDEDEILTSVPFFLTSVTSSADSIEPSMMVSHPRCEESWFMTPSSCLVYELPEENFLQVMPFERHVPAKPLSRTSCRSLIWECISLGPLSPTWKDALLPYPKQSSDVGCKTTTPRMKPSSAPYSRRSRHSRQDKRLYHPASTQGPFINAQSPFVISKTELLEQIKELKPAQHAKQHDLKKQLKKSHLDRQNKTYHFETSNKNRRRKDLWQRHSGANNNRKCC